MNRELHQLITDIQNCRVCAAHLSHGCNPLVQIHPQNQILVIGQAPGQRVHKEGQLWMDKSGDNLRNWLGVSKEDFYDSNLFGLMPMGFCYTGRSTRGDLPPREECAPLWHLRIRDLLPRVKMTLLVGQYAQKFYLKEGHQTLTETVKNFRFYLPDHFPLPHPSPRNFIWQHKNPWFRDLLIPHLQRMVRELISA